MDGSGPLRSLAVRRSNAPNLSSASTMSRSRIPVNVGVWPGTAIHPGDAQAFWGDGMAAKFEIENDHTGKFRFHLKAPNGEIICAS